METNSKSRINRSQETDIDSEDDGEEGADDADGAARSDGDAADGAAGEVGVDGRDDEDAEKCTRSPNVVVLVPVAGFDLLQMATMQAVFEAQGRLSKRTIMFFTVLLDTTVAWTFL